MVLSGFPNVLPASAIAGSQLQTQSAALEEISHNLSAASEQLSGFIADNRAQLRPALDKLNGVLTIVDNRKEQLQQSIKLLNKYGLSLGESVSAGPFFKGYVANLLPGTICAAVHRRRLLRPGRGPKRVVAVAADRPGDRSARHAGAADAIPAHRTRR